ncbi:MAG: NlpC/P60 family protein, partial [Planctomycetota bacterium]|nr:NlpC/P60 family protein [Planctomycetota bacterium]
MSDLDRRLHAFRPDLADVALRERVEATRFTEGRPAVVRRGVIDLLRAPDTSASIDTQLLWGEALTVFDVQGEWAWVKSHQDGYVGYTLAAALDEPWGEPTHHVQALRTFVYPEPDLKAPALDTLSFTSRVRITGEHERFAELAGGGWVFAPHLAAPDDRSPDHVATALRFLGTPYRWGGRTSVGLDCSALVQLALDRAGHACLRDSDMQERGVGTPVEAEGGIERGDLLFFPRHV